ncbi:MAG: hypothetical protein WCF84_10685 [Anaerolineae bacterium]
MSNWQKISIVLAGLLVLACVALAGLGFWAVSSGSGASALAALTGKTPTVDPASSLTDSSLAPAGPAGQPLPGARGAVAGLFGTVASVNGAEVTIANAQGKTQTITIGRSTRLVVTGVTTPTPADIQPGDKLLVFGVKKSAASLEPRAVIVAPASYTRDNIKGGQVQSVSGQTLTVRTAANTTLTVTIDASTQILGPLLQPVALDQVVDANALMIGQPGSNGVFTAQLIIARQAPGAAQAPNRRLQPTAVPSQTQ